jgi:hypothetical protein
MTSEPENNFKGINNYSPEELKQFREIFAVELKQYRASDRRYANPILVVILVGFAAVVCAFVLSQHPIKWLLGAGIILIAAGLVSIALAMSAIQKKLICPACQNLFLDEIGECCPECGSASLEPPGLVLGGRRCRACGKNLLSGKNRNFRYRACTHCGVFLDEKGL